MLDQLAADTQAPLSLVTLFINLGCGMIMALLIKYHYIYFSNVFTNKKHFSNVLTFVLLTTILIITVVKTSLALSLGLVGALSIVRFRTPIKEPEELGYLFLVIANGLGLGANQTIPTIVCSIIILVFVSALKWNTRESNDKNLFLNITIPKKENENYIDKVSELVKNHSQYTDLRRYDHNNESAHLIFNVSLKDAKSLEGIISSLSSEYSNSEITFTDQGKIASF